MQSKEVYLMQQLEKEKLISSDDIYDDTRIINISKLWYHSIQPKIKESTAIKYKNILKLYIYPFIGNFNIEDMDSQTIELYIDSLLKVGSQKGNGLSPKTVSDCISVLKCILNYAKTLNITVPDIDYSIHCQYKEQQITVLSKEEQQILIQYLLDSNDHKDLGILISLYAGLRVGEVCALQWENIDLKEVTLHISKTMQRIQDTSEKKGKTKILISTPKSHCSIRTIPIPEILYKKLEAVPEKEGYVVSNNCRKYVEPRTMQYHFKSILRKCGLKETNYHTLRHTFATMCVEVGFDIKSLSEILGHSSTIITMNRYVHPSMEMKRNNMNLLSNLYQ